MKEFFCWAVAGFVGRDIFNYELFLNEILTFYLIGIIINIHYIKEDSEMSFFEQYKDDIMAFINALVDFFKALFAKAESEDSEV